MDFALFLVLNVILLIRPEEMVPEIAGSRLYLIAIGACLLVSGGRVLSQLSPQYLARQPIVACVLGLLAAVPLSLIGRGQLGQVSEDLPEFAKVVLYFLLLIAVVDTPARLRVFLGWLVVAVLGLTVLALMQFHGVIDVEALRPLERSDGVYDSATGEVVTYLQLRGTGIFNDPNDLCLVLVAGSLCAVCRAALARGWLASLVWLAPLPVFGYAFMLTKSRGGLLGLAAAIFALLYSRYGWKRAFPLAVVLFPAMLLVLGGRQTDIDMGENDTAQHRMHLWVDGLTLLIGMAYGPHTVLTGIGAGTYADECGQVAHNSFVHAYVEMGLIGGGLFLAAFAIAGWGLYQARNYPSRNVHPELAKMRPFVFAMLAGYAAGVFSLSRDYVIPTYLILGLSSAYLGMLPPQALPWYRVDGPMARRVAAGAVAGLVFLKLFTQALVRY